MLLTCRDVHPMRSLRYRELPRGRRPFRPRARTLRCPPRRPGWNLHPQAPPPDHRRPQPVDSPDRPVRRVRDRQGAGPRDPLQPGLGHHLGLLRGLHRHHRDPVRVQLQAGVQADHDGAPGLRAGTGRPGARVHHRPLGQPAR